ncbi:MAG: site-specific integrase [Saprospiraceae bacterium]
MLSSFLNYLKHEKRYSSNTVISYHNDIEQFLAYVQDQYETEDLSLVTHFMIKSWLVSLKQSDMMNSSINRKLSSLRKFFLFLKRENYIENNPASKIVAPKMGKRLPSVIRKNEIDRLLDDILTDTDFSSVRDKLIIQILYNTGIRRAELINIEDKDIDFSNKFIKIFGKGNKERIVPMNEDIYSINEYVNIRNDYFLKNIFEKLILTDSETNSIQNLFIMS